MIIYRYVIFYILSTLQQLYMWPCFCLVQFKERLLYFNISSLKFIFLKLPSIVIHHVKMEICSEKCMGPSQASMVVHAETNTAVTPVRGRDHRLMQPVLKCS